MSPGFKLYKVTTPFLNSFLHEQCQNEIKNPQMGRCYKTLLKVYIIHRFCFSCLVIEVSEILRCARNDKTLKDRNDNTPKEYSIILRLLTIVIFANS